MEVAMKSMAQMVQRTRPSCMPGVNSSSANAPESRLPIILLSLQSIRLFDQSVGERVGHFKRLVLAQPVLGDQPGQEGTVDAPRHVVPRGNGQKGTGIVVETHRIVETRRLRRLLAVAHHALRTVMEPPCRTQPQAGIMPGQRSQFAAVGGLVQGEEDKSELALIAEAIEQGA